MTLKLTNQTLTAIRKHCTAELPNEACGFVLSVGRKQVYYPCRNTAPNPAETFEISADDWLAAAGQGEIAAIVHSHPDGGLLLSDADRQSQVASRVPWVLWTEADIKVFRCVPPLLGREFVYGEADCFTLVRDAFHLCGIDFRDHTRTTLDDDADEEAFLKYLPEGFRRVDEDPQAGDVILTAHAGKVSHALFYLGEDYVLHHAYDHLSRRQIYGSYLKGSTHSVWRHPEWSDGRLVGLAWDLKGG